MSKWWKEKGRKSEAQRRLEEYELREENWTSDGVYLVCADCRASWAPGNVLDVQHGPDCHITKHRQTVRESLAAADGEGEGDDA